MTVSEYFFLDRPEILQFVFFPRLEWGPPGPGVSDHLITVADGITVSARLFNTPRPRSFLLYFHGNGEIASDYGWSAPDYAELGVSLFVADYRGYGRGNGVPTLSNMVNDAPVVFRYARDIAVKNGVPRFYLMGRSLGSIPVVELAAGFTGEYEGLILESGLASLPRVLRGMGFQPPTGPSADLEKSVARRLAAITAPALVLHGENDSLIPLEEGCALYTGLGSASKEMVVVPGAGHNDIGLVGHGLYFRAIRRFLS